jgi:hypothetical protein
VCHLRNFGTTIADELGLIVVDECCKGSKITRGNKMTPGETSLVENHLHIFLGKCSVRTWDCMYGVWVCHWHFLGISDERLFACDP